MKIVILAAGQGLRMRPLTLETPKPLLIYRGKTAIDHIFDVLPDDVNEVILVVDYLAEKIQAYCKDEFRGRKVNYVKGSCGGNALGFLESKMYFQEKERFIVLYADDVLTKKEVEDCLSCEYAWLCYPVKNIHEVGIITKDQNGNVESFVEKPEYSDSNLAANGFMVVNSDIYSYKPTLHKNGEYYFSDLMAEFAKEHTVKVIIGSDTHSQLTSPIDIERLNKNL